MNEQRVGREARRMAAEDCSVVFKLIERSGWVVLALITLLVVSGCGGDNGVKPQPQPQDQGTPTAAGGLVIHASASGADTDSGMFSTGFEATVTDTTGAAVSGATVTMSDDGGSVPLTEVPGTPGTYRASRSGLPSGMLTLDVTAGTAQLLGATVPVPDLHVITSHGPNDVIQASHPIHLTWSRAAAATEATIETKNYQGAPEVDDGTKTIPTPGNPARNDQAIRVTRANRVPLAGAAPGSTLQASVRTSVEPIVAQ
ncbi:MAG TPA: carboxypeptidase-like regulatory domain-containing protein [Candidatus Eisenbacteria bacterium]|nr:carboxypeptidase-like regulatory domain-containing protein [Candidatus Eisenbacteria bacterium]